MVLTCTRLVIYRKENMLLNVIIIVRCYTSAGSSGTSSGNEVCQRSVCTRPCSLQIPASASSRRSVSQYKYLLLLIYLPFSFFLFFLYDCFFFIHSREEVSGEARRALRSFPAKNAEKEHFKPMPSFAEMVSYIQEKVRTCVIKMNYNV